MKMSIKKIKLTVLSAMAIGVVACNGATPVSAPVAPFIVSQYNNNSSNPSVNNTVLYAYNNGELQKVTTVNTDNSSVFFC